ncbi:MAG: amidohydrolase [Candidatus Dormibacteraeota bacterium]|nr:amidohydrolase [Candidatus Dormibacteraeota bacterium]
MPARAILFKGCRPEVAAGPDGRILAVGAAARAAAGRDAEVVEIGGRVLPGLHDAHLHLEWLALRYLTVDLQDVPTRRQALARVRAWAERLPAGAWVVGRGWYNDAWRDDPSWPRPEELDAASGGRPAILTRKDGHSAWLSNAAVRAAGLRAEDQDPPGTVKETMIQAVRRLVPEPSDAAFDRGMLRALRALAGKGITSVHTMDTPRAFRSFQRLHTAGRLPLRVTWNFPAADLAAAERIGIRSGWGDDTLRIWGVKAFLDGSLGSRTAEMLDGTGVTVLPQDELEELVRRCAAADLNVCLHAIGDRAVRRALDALEPHAGAWRKWRPRIEHAQCVDPADVPRFKRSGAIASMQPIHAVADRELADREWPAVAAHSYAWRPLLDGGAVLAFGSDAPVEDAAPLLGIDAATGWRKRAGWHPELAIRRAAAIRAYTAGAAYAAGTEKSLGRLAPGMLSDLTFVDGDHVMGTVVGGRVTWRPS